MIIVSKDGKPIRSITHADDGSRIFHPNDCIKDDHGGVYITAPGHFARSMQPMGKIFYLAANGKTQQLKDKLTYPNGIAIYNGELYVSEHLANRVIKFKITKNTRLGKASLFANIPHKANPPHLSRRSPKGFPDDTDIIGPDGIEISKNGKIHIAHYGASEILIYNPKGERTGRIKTQGQFTTNMALSPDGALTITAPKELESPLQSGMVYQLETQKILLK